MTARQRTPREISRALRMERAARGVAELRRAVAAAEQQFAAELDAVAPSMRESAYNLVHYLAVRNHELRELQEDLACLGLSSLGRLEAHVVASLQAVGEALSALRGEPLPDDAPEEPPVTFETGGALLAEHANAILGPTPRGLNTRIMVTIPGHAADDPALVRDLVDAGMGIMRINCAHDDADVWQRLVKRLRRAERDAGKRCLVSFDLAGPKLRTGALAPGPQVVKWRSARDAIGRVVAPARIRFVTHARPPDVDEATIPLDGDLLGKAKRGDTISLEDTRERRRMLRVVDVSPDECRCETETTAYVVPGTRLTLHRRGRAIATANVGPLPTVEASIELHVGDTLEVARSDTRGRDAVHDAAGAVVEPAVVPCSLPEVFASVRVGEPILFDDGRIAGRIRAVTQDRLRVEITHVAGGAAKLKAEKGINLPESELSLPSFTAKDAEHLAFAVKHADMVAMSFVQRPEDIDALAAAMSKHKASRLGIVLKIETRSAFDRLPLLLLAAMRHPPVAVMLARGDLGVEVGFERLSEVQEEILWLCEAAHVPVIWATQVLESLAKGGMPSRAEVSDAAMAGRAECVMLNKGPYILDTMRFLIGVLRRMADHQHKKTARLRKLSVSDVRARSTRRKVSSPVADAKAPSETAA